MILRNTNSCVIRMFWWGQDQYARAEERMLWCAEKMFQIWAGSLFKLHSLLVMECTCMDKCCGGKLESVYAIGQEPWNSPAHHHLRVRSHYFLHSPRHRLHSAPLDFGLPVHHQPAKPAMPFTEFTKAMWSRKQILRLLNQCWSGSALIQILSDAHWRDGFMGKCKYIWRIHDKGTWWASMDGFLGMMQ